MTVFVVQEIKKYHCPKCGWSKLQRTPTAEFRYACENRRCLYEFNEGSFQPVFDVTPARIYGELKVLITSNAIGISVQPLISILRSNLKDFSDDDYIIAVGDPVAIGIVTAIAAENNRGRVKMLRWDRQTRQYVEMSINTRGASVVDTERKRT
jgi:ribosomal protein L37AE/L43A